MGSLSSQEPIRSHPIAFFSPYGTLPEQLAQPKAQAVVVKAGRQLDLLPGSWTVLQGV
jgi:hypothetical protein